MASDREQFIALVQRGDIKSRELPEALSVAGIAPDLARWRSFVDSLLLWLGACSLAAGALFFVAYNWAAMGRFAKFALIQSLLVLAVGCFVWLRKREGVDKVSLLVASILVGVLLALYGQTYQTGADPWELFAYWALLILPWTVINRFMPLWMLWIGLLNVALMLYADTFKPTLADVLGHEETLVLCLALLNGLGLVVLEWRRAHHDWLDDLWSPRILATATTIAATMLGLYAVIENFGSITTVLFLIWAAVVGLLVYYYRRRRADLFMLAAACFSTMSVVLGLLIEYVFDNISGDGGQFFLMAFAIVAMGATCAVWLRKTQKTMYAESSS